MNNNGTLTRHNRAWAPDEDRTLQTLFASGASADEIATAMKRTAKAVYLRHTQLCKPSLLADHVEPPPQADHPDIDTFLWYMREAWNGGLTVTIPDLGATFRKPDK